MSQNTYQLMVPADVPPAMVATYQENHRVITHDTGKLFLFAADQKMEHLNKDFSGQALAPEINDPEHLFKIASQGTIGAFATHVGLIAEYGRKYPTISYLAKLNGKTNLMPVLQADPKSCQLWSVNDVVKMNTTNTVTIRAVGCTVYLGSEHEGEMLTQAAQIITQAHQHGLIAVVWVYPRGKAVSNEYDYQLIAGAAGVAASLGADFVKLHAPNHDASTTTAQALNLIAQAAGTTQVIYSGGHRIDQQEYLQRLYEQLHNGANGTACGRNIFQHPLPQAVAFTNAIAALVLQNKTVKEAMALLC